MKLFRTDGSTKGGYRLYYGKKSPLNNLNKYLKTFLYSCSVKELESLEINFKSAAKAIKSINDELQPLVKQALADLREHKKLKEKIIDNVWEQYPDPVKIFFISSGDQEQVTHKREKVLRQRFQKTLLPIETKLKSYDESIFAAVKLQYEALDQLLPKDVRENVVSIQADDERFLPDLSVDISDVKRNGERDRFAHFGYYHTGLTSYFDKFLNILDVLPKIISEKNKTESSLRIRKKRQERSATLAAYEDKSRNIGKSIMAKMKADIKAPYHCPYCKKKTPKTKIHVDHINPISNGGLSVERNLVPVCADCNLQKRDLSLRAFSRKSKLDFESICDTLESMGKFI